MDGSCFPPIEVQKWSFVGAATFSPDSQSLAYMARPPEGWVLVVDGKPAGKTYHSVSHIVFDTPTRLHFIGERHVKTDEHQFLLVEATRMP